MGNPWSKLMNKLFGDLEVRILMLGLDGAGKTTVTYKVVNLFEVTLEILAKTRQEKFFFR